MCSKWLKKRNRAANSLRRAKTPRRCSEDLPQGEEGRHVGLVHQLLIKLCPAAPAERQAERAAPVVGPVLVPSLRPAVAHHPQAHAVLFQLSHEVSSMRQQGVQGERLSVRLVEQGLLPEAKHPTHLAEPRKAIAVLGVFLFPKI